VIKHLIRAHRQAFIAIKKINPQAQIGIAKNNVYFEAAEKKFVNRCLKKFADCWWNEYFLHFIKDRQDFIGLNHYYHHRIDRWFNKNEDDIVSDMGWELYPQSIYHILKDLKKYQKPIYITESGLADATDQKRTWYILGILKNIYRAISDGVDVRGYLHWALLDNFEWEKGFWPRFGLIEVDYETLERKIRPSAYFYRDIIRENGITKEIVNKYAKQIEVYPKETIRLSKVS
jgi:beta-glucosidase